MKTKSASAIASSAGDLHHHPLFGAGAGSGNSQASQHHGASWDPAIALQMSQLFGGGPGGTGSNPETLAQLNAASQLIAASLLQQQQQNNAKESHEAPPPPTTNSRKSSAKSSSSAAHHSPPTSASSSSSSPLLCSICGQVSRDQSDYEAHLMTHISLLSSAANPNAAAYQYSLNLLRMQNLFNGGSNSASTNPASIPGSTVPNGASSSSTSTILNKKRKLLASHHAELMENEEKKNRSEGFGDFDRLGLEQLLKGSASADSPTIGQEHSLMMSQHAQSLLAQLAAQASKGSQGGGSGLASPTSPSTALSLVALSTAAPTCAGSTTLTTSSGATSTVTMSTAFPCTSCHKTFATEVDLKAHLIRHLTQHPFACSSCGKGFKYEHSLNFHIKSYHSGGSSTGGKSGSASGAAGTPDGKGGKGKSDELKLKKSRANLVNAHPEAELDQEEDAPKNQVSSSSSKLGNSPFGLNIPTTTSSLLHSRLTLMDENHNASGTLAPSTGKGFTSELSYFFGKPPTNLPSDSPIQIRSEKLLISILDAVNVATDQSIILYKCCLCCVAFGSLDQMAIHVQNVHPTPSGAATLLPADLLGAAGGVGGGFFGGKDNSSHAQQQQQQLSCDKCTAKFTVLPEYEMHMQLHRTLEAQATGTATAQVSAGSAHHGAHSAMYPFSLLSHLTGTGHQSIPSSYSGAPSQAPATVDFRQILANASKDTDFGRKFAAQLLQDSTKDILDSPYGHHRGVGLGGGGVPKFDTSAFDRCSPPTTPASAKMSNSSSNHSNDNNNNSLLYLSLLPEHAKASTGSSAPGGNARFSKSSSIDSTSASAILNLSQETKQSCASTPEKPPKKSRTANMEGSTGKSNGGGSASSGSASGNGNSLRHIKEPVDIFEGAGQSLPIQKFPLGDIEETAPGQFKCRFCDKTFDRVFSVHRHERVHTGFKPCICKTCGRGFSEKRNLRHHIIRFHSDGSGRELLKRKRKPKNGIHGPLGEDGSPLFLRNDSLMSSFLGSHGNAGGVSESLFNAFRAQQANSAASVASALNGSGSLSNLKMSLAELDSLKSAFDGDPMNLSNGMAGCHQMGANSGGSSTARRRKGSKPSRTVYDDEDDSEEDGRRHGMKKEMLVVDVDVMPMVEESDDDDLDEDDEDEELEDDLDDDEMDHPDTEEHEEEYERSWQLRKKTQQVIKEEKSSKSQVKDVAEEAKSASVDGDETEEEEVDAEAEVAKAEKVKGHVKEEPKDIYEQKDDKVQNGTKSTKGKEIKKEEEEEGDKDQPSKTSDEETEFISKKSASIKTRGGNRRFKRRSK